MLLLCVVVGKSCAEAVTSAEEQGCQGLKMEGGEGEDEEEGEGGWLVMLLLTSSLPLCHTLSPLQVARTPWHSLAASLHGSLAPVISHSNSFLHNVSLLVQE